MHYNGKTYVGSIASDGDVLVHTYDHSTDTMSSATTLKAAMEVDDHDHPSLLIRDSDKKLLAFYSKHDLSPVYLRISTNAEDATSWAAEVDLNAQLGGGTDFTYPCPVQLLSETNDPIYLFLRHIPSGGTENLVMSKSTDGGATWSSKTTIYTPGAGVPSYRKIVSNGTDRIDFAVTNNHPASGATSLYHFYYQGGNYYKSDGTQIMTALPLGTSDLTLVYDGSTERCWVADIALEPGTGYPIIAFPTFPAASTARLRYARWDGSAWDVTTILDNAGNGISSTAGPQDYYFGGMSIDPVDTDVVYLTRRVVSGWEIWRYETADSGATWTGTAVTANTDTKNYRPVVPRNRAADLPVLWLQGTYTSYTSWSTALRGI